MLVLFLNFILLLLLVAQRPRNTQRESHGGSALTSGRAAALADQAISQSRCTDTGPTSPRDDPQFQAPIRVARRVQGFKPRMWLSRGKRGAKPVSLACEADTVPLSQ